MAERRENSVLFSLKELRNIEDGRVKKEKEEADARVEAERAAKAAAERARVEAEERARREEEDRVRRIEEEKLNREREEQIRLQEAERRARVEGEVRLQEQRLHLEAQAKREQKSPMKAIMGVTGALVLIAGGLGYKMYSDHQAELSVERARAAEIQEQAKREKAEVEARLAAIQKDMDAKLSKAQTDAERAQIKLEAERARAAASGGRSTHVAAKKADEPAAKPIPAVAKKKTINDNPLDGLFDEPGSKTKK
jgi:hypothetical protein